MQAPPTDPRPMPAILMKAKEESTKKEKRKKQARQIGTDCREVKIYRFMGHDCICTHLAKCNKTNFMYFPFKEEEKAHKGRPKTTQPVFCFLQQREKKDKDGLWRLSREPNNVRRNGVGCSGWDGDKLNDKN